MQPILAGMVGGQLGEGGRPWAALLLALDLGWIGIHRLAAF